MHLCMRMVFIHMVCEFMYVCVACMHVNVQAFLYVCAIYAYDMCKFVICVLYMYFCICAACMLCIHLCTCVVFMHMLGVCICVSEHERVRKPYKQAEVDSAILSIFLRMLKKH